jgi:hypothetical protein
MSPFGAALRVTFTSGFTSATVPPRVVHAIAECTKELFKSSANTTGDDRFGVTSISTSQGGMTVTQQLESRAQEWRVMLADLIML